MKVRSSCLDGASCRLRIRLLVPLAIISLMALWPAVLLLIFEEYPSVLLPTVLDHIFGYLALFVLMRVRSPLLLVSGYVWIAWYFIGTINVVASSLVLGNYYSNLDISKAAHIYLTGCLAYVLGCFVFEKLFLSVRSGMVIRSIQSKLSRASRLVLLMFPLLWIASLYFTLGYIPVLSGYDITDEIYDTYYGLLYPYTSLLVLSAVYAMYLHIKNRTNIALYYLAFVILVSFADGKRVVAMTFLFASMPLLFRYYGTKAWRRVVLGCVALISLYVVVIFARVGGISDRFLFEGIASFMIIGVEFRDFVYSVNYYSPGEVQGYSWLLSGLASMGNNLIFSLLGVEKTELVRMGSAYVWSDLFGSPFGIRTGIVSEVWFAYGIFSFVVLFLLGLLTGHIVNKINKTKSEFGLVFWSSTFGLILLSVVGQTTAITGTFVLFVYVYAAVLAERIAKRWRNDVAVVG